MGTSLVESKQSKARAEFQAQQLQLGLDGSAHAADSAAGATQHLLARRSVLDDTLRRTQSVGATALLRSPPIPAALLMLTVKRTRQRFKNLLNMANLEVDVCTNVADALEQLATRVHALMFTDDLQLIRSARQLPSGVAITLCLLATAVN